MNRRALLFAAGVSSAAGIAEAADWPQWRGPRRNGQSSEKGVLSSWPAGAMPKVAWRRQAGKGHSSVSIAGGLAYTMGWDGEKDTVFCLDAATGAIRWQQSYPCKTIVQWPGPRATPTVAGNRVYTLGQHGQFYAWDAGSGAEVWKVQLSEAYNPDVDYGFAWSPLLMGGLLILGAGRNGLALRVSDGSFAWGNDEHFGACASAVPFEHQGRTGVVVLAMDDARDNVSLVGVDPRDGKELWRSAPWPEKWGAACVDPLVSDGKLFLTTAEQFSRCARFSITPDGLKQDWSNANLASYTGSLVLVEGHIYGINRQGRLKCLDWNTGVEKWSEPGFDGHGSLITADGLLFLQTSRRGELVLASADPTGYKELRRTKVFEGAADTFTTPVLANGRLYCRSYAGEVVCLVVGATAGSRASSSFQHCVARPCGGV